MLDITTELLAPNRLLSLSVLSRFRRFTQFPRSPPLAASLPVPGGLAYQGLPAMTVLSVASPSLVSPMLSGIFRHPSGSLVPMLHKRVSYRELDPAEVHAVTSPTEGPSSQSVYYSLLLFVLSSYFLAGYQQPCTPSNGRPM